MKIKFFGILIALLFSGVRFAVADMGEMSHHNMILFGYDHIYLSHLVYKSPHNYQVELEINLDPDTKAKYLSARAQHPNELFIFLLDPIEIKNIAAQSVIGGTIFFVDQNGQHQTIASNVTVLRRNFQVIYFNELPLSLEPEHG